MGLAGQEALGLKGLVVGGLRARVHWTGRRGERMVGGPGSLSVERFEGSSPWAGDPAGRNAEMWNGLRAAKPLGEVVR